MNTLFDQIESYRKKLGRSVLVLGHHYQSDEVIVHTDLRGDSYQLSAMAAQNTECDHIVFCGVHFMAETADILANQTANLEKRNGKRINVLIPDTQAGCFMADLAPIAEIEKAWAKLATFVDVRNVVPITYVNSSAALKAFCGRNGGIACTSSNAQAVLEWALNQNKRVFFFPDSRLGINTALHLGYSRDDMAGWTLIGDTNRALPDEFHSDERIKSAKFLFWEWYCDVHQLFRPEQIDRFRKNFPEVRIIVHPECMPEVVALADAFGSTNHILEAVGKSPAGTHWAVGTEARLVDRLKKMYPDKRIDHLSGEPAVCKTMNLITPERLASVLENLIAGKAVNVVRVDSQFTADALVCLQRMLEVT